MKSPLEVLKKPTIQSAVIVLSLANAFGQGGTDAGSKIDKIEGVYRVGGPVSAPGLVYTPNPEYSKAARDAKYEGTCVLMLIVDANGCPRDVKVARTLGLGLDDKAVEAVKQWRFRPAMKDGKPVAVPVNVEVHFRLSDKPDSTPGVETELRRQDVDTATPLTVSQSSTPAATPLNRRIPQEELAELLTKCTPYTNTRVEDLESQRVPLPPHNAPGFLPGCETRAWRTYTCLASLRNSSATE